MTKVRRIRKVLKGRPTLEGAGVHLKRIFGYPHLPQFDPFLLLDDFSSDERSDYIRGFPWHPHRGIETITYVLKGIVEHGDSLGNEGMIESGDVQWMTAGSGIVHQEMPKGDAEGAMWGFQLWANLPAAQKMMEPRYRDVKRDQIPEVGRDNGVSVRIICGEMGGVRGPVQDIVIDPEYLDVRMPPGTSFKHRVQEGYTVFAYVIEGEGYFEPGRDPYGYEVEGKSYFEFERESAIGSESLVVFGDGDELAIQSESSGARFLLISGKPIGEPIAWSGPIVMNTQEELRNAFNEFREGTFLKHGRT